MKYEQLYDACQDDTNKIYIFGLNSSFDIDHISQKKSAISLKAIMKLQDLWDLEGNFKNGDVAPSLMGVYSY